MSSLYGVVSTASSLPGVSVVSMSWGTNEYYGEWNSNSVFLTPAGHTNVTFIAASGDQGAWSGPSYPAVSQNVLAVGGSTLTVGSGNTYGSETGWSDSTGGFSGLDNGFQYGLSIPIYQVSTLTASGLNYGLRTTPDVSFNADPNSGVAVYDSVSYSGQSGWFTVGGTSAAAPAWAGLVAITDQGLAQASKGTLSNSQLQTELYSLPSAAYHDMTTGFNGYSASQGYDLVTGLGTPVANVLVPDLLAANGVTIKAGATTASTSTSTSTSTHARREFPERPLHHASVGNVGECGRSIDEYGVANRGRVGRNLDGGFNVGGSIRRCLVLLERRVNEHHREFVADPGDVGNHRDVGDDRQSFRVTGSRPFAAGNAVPMDLGIGFAARHADPRRDRIGSS